MFTTQGIEPILFRVLAHVLSTSPIYTICFSTCSQWTCAKTYRVNWALDRDTDGDTDIVHVLNANKLVLKFCMINRHRNAWKLVPNFVLSTDKHKCTSKRMKIGPTILYLVQIFRYLYEWKLVQNFVHVYLVRIVRHRTCNAWKLAKNFVFSTDIDIATHENWSENVVSGTDIQMYRHRNAWKLVRKFCI